VVNRLFTRRRELDRFRSVLFPLLSAPTPMFPGQKSFYERLPTEDLLPNLVSLTFSFIAIFCLIPRTPSSDLLVVTCPRILPTLPLGYRNKRITKKFLTPLVPGPRVIFPFPILLGFFSTP